MDVYAKKGLPSCKEVVVVIMGDHGLKERDWNGSNRERQIDR